MIVIRSPQKNGLKGLILGPETPQEEKICDQLLLRATKAISYKAPKIPKPFKYPKKIR